MKSFAFPKSLRLRKSKDFLKILRRKQNSKQFFLEHIKAKVVFDKQQLDSVMGITIARKVVASAVKRNLIKRLVRETFRQNHQNLPKCSIIVFVNNSSIINLENIEIVKELKKMFDKIKIYNNNKAQK